MHGNGKRRQRSARHQQLLAYFHNLNQFGGIVIKVNHIAGFLGGLRPAVHGHADIGLRQSRGVIRPVPHHGNQLAGSLLLPDITQLIFGLGFRDEIINSGFFRDIPGRARIIPRHHYRLHPHLAQAFEALFYARLDDILQFNNADNLPVDAANPSGTYGSYYNVTYFTTRTNNGWNTANNMDFLMLNLGNTGWVSMQTPSIIKGKYKVTLRFGYATSMEFIRTSTGGSNGGKMIFSFDGENSVTCAPYTS